MSIDVMKQALEALVWEAEGWEDVPPITRDAIIALRAAIEQAERPQTHSEECWRWHHECAVAKVEQVKDTALKRLGRITTLEAELKQRQWQGLTEAEIDAFMPVADGSAEIDATPVEVSPGIWGKEYYEVDAWSRPLVIELARAIEAKLKEKNNGLS